MITIITRCMTIDPTSHLYQSCSRALDIATTENIPGSSVNKGHVSTCIKVYNLVEKLTISKEQTKSLNNFFKITFH